MEELQSTNTTNNNYDAIVETQQQQQQQHHQWSNSNNNNNDNNNNNSLIVTPVEKIIDSDNSNNINTSSSSYIDYLHTSISYIRKQRNIPNNIRNGPRGGVDKPFPIKLYELLENADKQNFTNIISWLPHGRSFVIYNTKIFAKEILPRYFNHNKMSSFSRQLNLYDFQRVINVDNSKYDGHYHPLFLRGRPDICTIMIRTKRKCSINYNNNNNNNSNNNKRNNNLIDILKDNTKINFYKFPPCPPLSKSSDTNVFPTATISSSGNSSSSFKMTEDTKTIDDGSSVRSNPSSGVVVEGSTTSSNATATIMTYHNNPSQGAYSAIHNYNDNDNYCFDSSPKQQQYIACRKNGLQQQQQQQQQQHDSSTTNELEIFSDQELHEILDNFPEQQQQQVKLYYDNKNTTMQQDNNGTTTTKISYQQQQQFDIHYNNNNNNNSKDSLIHRKINNNEGQQIHYNDNNTAVGMLSSILGVGSGTTTNPNNYSLIGSMDHNDIMNCFQSPLDLRYCTINNDKKEIIMSSLNTP